MSQTQSYNAREYMPHRPPMAMIDTVCIGPDTRYILLEIRPDNLFLREDGILERSVYPELAAQGAAAINSINCNGNVRPGVLAMAKNITYGADARAGDTLRIDATEDAPMEDWRIVYFTITRISDGALCAKGQLNLCLV